MSKLIRVSLTDYDSATGVIEKTWQFDADTVEHDSLAESVLRFKAEFNGYHLSITERVRDPRPRRSVTTVRPRGISA